MKKNAIKLTGLACIVALCMALAACAPDGWADEDEEDDF